MAAGLELYDATGAAQMLVTYKYSQILGVFTANGPGSLVDARFTPGTPFVICTIIGDYGYYGVGIEASVSGNTLSWAWPPNLPPGVPIQRLPTIIYYGVNR